MAINTGIFGDETSFKERFITDYGRLSMLVEYWKEMGLKIVLTSGAFDIFHIGHAEYLEKAKKMGDILIVGVDSDEKIRARKGPNRPVVPEIERISVLAHLRHVDVIVLKPHNAPQYHLINTVKPDVLVLSKTSRHSEEGIREREKLCGKVALLEPQAITSTTAKIRILHTQGIHNFAKNLTNDFIKLIEEKLKEIQEGKQ
ncbi:MAG: adenylyltransferase/cytidyltransferase family protein [Patescibacteria group bacterium]